jgi:transposase
MSSIFIINLVYPRDVNHRGVADDQKGGLMDIKTQVEQGMYQKNIADELGVHPKTVSRTLKRGGPPSGARSKARKSVLDPINPLSTLSVKGV